MEKLTAGFFFSVSLTAVCLITLYKNEFPPTNVFCQGRKSAVVKYKCASLYWWHGKKHCEHIKPAVVATLSLHTLSIRGLPSSTRPDWRERVQGKDHASFGQAVTLPRPMDDRAQMDSPDILLTRSKGKGMTARI